MVSTRDVTGTKTASISLPTALWYSQTGQEQLFDLNADPNEHFDLVRQPVNSALPDVWRPRMIGTLRERPEGFTDRERLIAGQRHDVLVET